MHYTTYTVAVMFFDMWQPVNHGAECVKAQLSWNTLSLGTQQGRGNVNPILHILSYAHVLIEENA